MEKNYSTVVLGPHIKHGTIIKSYLDIASDVMWGPGKNMSYEWYPQTSDQIIGGTTITAEYEKVSAAGQRLPYVFLKQRNALSVGFQGIALMLCSTLQLATPQDIALYMPISKEGGFVRMYRSSRNSSERSGRLPWPSRLETGKIIPFTPYIIPSVFVERVSHVSQTEEAMFIILKQSQ